MIGANRLVAVGGTLCFALGPAHAQEEWCDRIVGGSPGVRELAVDLSEAHAAVRFFGTQSAYSAADQALVSALEPAEALSSRWRDTVEAYVGRLDSVCALRASARDLHAARVDGRAEVAVIHPGTGAVVLGAGTRAVIIDLRGLPAVDGLRAALETAVTGALATPVERPVRRVRRHYGMTDEVLSPYNVYRNDTVDLAQPAIPATGSANLPVALITD